MDTLKSLPKPSEKPKPVDDEKTTQHLGVGALALEGCCTTHVHPLKIKHKLPINLYDKIMAINKAKKQWQKTILLAEEIKKNTLNVCKAIEAKRSILTGLDHVHLRFLSIQIEISCPPWDVMHIDWLIIPFMIGSLRQGNFTMSLTLFIDTVASRLWAEQMD